VPAALRAAEHRRHLTENFPFWREWRKTAPANSKEIFGGNGGK